MQSMIFINRNKATKFILLSETCFSIISLIEMFSFSFNSCCWEYIQPFLLLMKYKTVLVGWFNHQLRNKILINEIKLTAPWIYAFHLNQYHVFFFIRSEKIIFFEKYDLKKKKTTNEYVGDTDVVKYTSVKHIWVKNTL